MRKEDIKKKAQTESDAISYRMIQAAKTLERMVNQNIFDEIAQGWYFNSIIFKIIIIYILFNNIYFI